jgi:hypothetical protein
VLQSLSLQTHVKTLRFQWLTNFGRVVQSDIFLTARVLCAAKLTLVTELFLQHRGVVLIVGLLQGGVLRDRIMFALARSTMSFSN